MTDFNPNKDYYYILGVKKFATAAEIQHAFDDLKSKCGPQATSGDSELQHNRFREACEAYEVLIDPERRQQYDAARPEEDDDVTDVRSLWGQQLRKKKF